MKFLIAFFLVLPFSALAHDDAEWIMKSPSFAYCCGPQDCEKLPDGAVVQSQDGFRVILSNRTFVVPYQSPHLHKSIDGDYWLCTNEDRESETFGQYKCLFVPAGS